jgi:hypothetical protein
MIEARFVGRNELLGLELVNSDAPIVDFVEQIWPTVDKSV